MHKTRNKAKSNLNWRHFVRPDQIVDFRMEQDLMLSNDATSRIFDDSQLQVEVNLVNLMKLYKIFHMFISKPV